MRPSTLILAGGAAVAGFLLWRAYRGAPAPDGSKCAPATSAETSTTLRDRFVSRPSVCGSGVTLSVAGRTTAAPVQSAPPILAAPKSSGVAQTEPKTTTTTRLSSYSYTGRISL